jgi:hypothetical protein
MLSRQTQAMTNQFNQQMETMRQEFRESQRMLVTELSQTRQTVQLANQIHSRGQTSRGIIQPQGNNRMQENIYANGRSLNSQLRDRVSPPRPPSNPQIVQQDPLLNSQQSIPSAQPQVGGSSRPVQPSLIPVPINSSNNASADANNGRAMPTFHLKAAEIPKYKGAEETQTPYEFLVAAMTL